MKGKRQAYWALVESYRTEQGPRQRTVAWLGKLKASERAGVKRAAEGNKKSPYTQLQLFDQDEKLEPEWVELIRRMCGWKINSNSAGRGSRWN